MLETVKLPCYTLPPTRQYSSFRNLPPLLQVTSHYIIIITRFILVIKETQVEAAEGNEDFPFNNSSGENRSLLSFFVCAITQDLALEEFVNKQGKLYH